MIQKWIRPGSISGMMYNRGITYSRINYKKRKPDEKKTDDADAKKLKNKIKILRIADIWKNMTVQELANSLEKDIGNMMTTTNNKHLILMNFISYQ